MGGELVTWLHHGSRYKVKAASSSLKGSVRRKGALFGSPCNKDHSVLGSIFGALINGNPM